MTWCKTKITRKAMTSAAAGGAFLTLTASSLTSIAQAERSEPVVVRGGVAATLIAPRLSVRDRVSNVLNHPAFSGHGRLLMPWDARDYDPDMPLTEIGSLLPNHSHVNSQVVVDALNRMIDDVNAGKVVRTASLHRSGWNNG